MKVQGKTGKFYEVDESGKCSCSSNAERGLCSHSLFFNDVFKNKSYKYHYEIKQAFVAEFRRRGAEVINWARIICKSKGLDYFIRFIRWLLRTETRNLSALEQSYQTRDPKVLISLLLRSPCLHENPYYMQAYKGIIEGFYRYQEIEYKKYRSPVQMLREFMNEAHDLQTAYIVLYFMEDNRELLNTFVRMLYDRATDDRNWELVRYLELSDLHSPSSWRFAVELMVRFWNPEAEALRPELIYPDFYLPAMKPYQASLKTLKPIFEKHHKKIRPNRTIAKDVRCDLRYSDSWFGFFWRALAIEQRGSIEDLEWDDVHFSVNDWLSAQVLDKRYYPTLYQNILLAG